MHPHKNQSFPLEAGQLDLAITAGEGGLFEIAERINPKRAFLFVSTVLGRHIPVDPRTHRAALQRLSAKVDAQLGPGPIFVMGFAETAIGIGAGVYDCLCAQHLDRSIAYLCTTRFKPRDATVWFTIEEAHSHAVDHVILKPEAGTVPQGPGATLVLVDDETTTGKTFQQLAVGLRDQGLNFDHVVLVTLTDWSAGAAERSIDGIFRGSRVNAVNLQSGTWRWTPEPRVARQALPPACPPTCPSWTPSLDQTFSAPRGGLSNARPGQGGGSILERLHASGLSNFDPAHRVLVIGAGEHVWMPMQLAECIAARGLQTRFITTTRSPILLGRAIRAKTIFPDHYGEGFEMYMHNVHPADWDRIVLCTETTPQGLPAELTRYFESVDIIDGYGRVQSADMTKVTA